METRRQRRANTFDIPEARSNHRKCNLFLDSNELLVRLTGLLLAEERVY